MTLSDLSPTELEILYGLCAEETDAQLGQRVGRCRWTVQMYTKGLFGKFGCRSRLGLVRQFTLLEATQQNAGRQIPIVEPK